MWRRRDLRYETGGNGDARANRWQVEDGLESTTNYLGKRGWHRDKRWGHKVRLAPAFD